MSGFGVAVDVAVNGAFVAIALADAFKPSGPGEAKTNVQIILGGGAPTAGGPAPHIALWDNGKHIGTSLMPSL